MYRNDENRLIIKDKNFVVYLNDENNINNILNEILDSNEFNNEEIMIMVDNLDYDIKAIRKENNWLLENTKKPINYR